MSRRNYTRELLAEVRAGRVPVNSLGPEGRVEYAPRRKADPKPWINPTTGLRYSGRYCHTVEACGARLDNGRTCMMPKDHEQDILHSPISPIRYVYS